jgi:hypothetical protein
MHCKIDITFSFILQLVNTKRFSLIYIYKQVPYVGIYNLKHAGRSLVIKVVK